MDYVIGFLCGAATVALTSYLQSRIRSRRFGAAADALQSATSIAAPTADTPNDDSAPPDSSSVEVVPREAASERLVDLAGEFERFYARTSKPSDVLAHENFREGVRLLASSDFAPQEVLAYCWGENAEIQCMALEAVRHRDDMSGMLLEPGLRHLNSVPAWPLFFLVRSLDQTVPDAFLMRALFRLRPDLTGSQRTEVLRDLVVMRLAREGTPTFRGREEQLSDDRLSYLRHLLRDVDSDGARALLEELRGMGGLHIDTTFLKGLGRIWDGTDEEVIVEQESLLAAVSRLEESVEKSPARSVLLVGDDGVGKTTLVRVLGRRLRAKKWVVFEAGVVDIVAGTAYVGELEERLKELLENIGGSRRALWVIPQFEKLLWAGRHKNNPAGVLELVLPAIESGTIVVVGEIIPEVYEALVRELPSLRSALDTFDVPPSSDDETIDLASKWLATRDGLSIERADLLKESLQIARQYFGAKTLPGGLMRILRLTVRRITGPGAPTPHTLTLEAVLETLADLTGLPHSILDDRRRLDLDDLRDLFNRRVMGQPEAVGCLVERVAMIKSGLTDPTRPLGVFFFAGPTGTGKTEIAKTLAEFLFGSPDRMIRLDMSEFQTYDSIDRIVGDDSRDGRSTALVHQIRKQPFAVVLLDEFEKADSSVWDLFLQIFDDGRLTDRQGRSADFRHAIIILTSNLGSKVFDIGFGSDGRAGHTSVERAITEVFRKEFINRIDRVVPFRPLSRTVMRSILQKELDLALQRRGLRSRSWAVEWEDSATEFLLDRGFDSSLGARPLRRAIERYVLSPLAITIVNHQFPDGDQFLFVRSDGEKISVEFIDPDAPDGGALPPVAEPVVAQGPSRRVLTLGEIILAARGDPAEFEHLRERYDRLRQHVDTSEWRSRKSDYLEKISAPDFWEWSERFPVLGSAEYMDRIEAGLDAAGSVMDRLQGQSPTRRSRFSTDLTARLAQQLYLLESACRGFDEGRPRDAYIRLRAQRQVDGLYDRSNDFTGTLGDMYVEWARHRKMTHRLVQKGSGDRERPASLVLAVSGFDAFGILSPESGLHVLEEPSGRERPPDRYNVRVDVAPQSDYPTGENRRERRAAALEALGELPDEAPVIVRRYQERPSPLVRDTIRKWRTGKLRLVLEGNFDLFSLE